MVERAGVRADRVRLVDVAERAGVTKSVASRVLNGDPTLSAREETRQRVRDAASALGYQPHAGARALARAQARAIALLIPDLTNPVFSRIIRGAYQRALELGYVVLLVEDGPERKAGEMLLDLISSGRVDGLLIASARSGGRWLRGTALASVPHVFVNREVRGSKRNVTTDLAGGSAVAVRHLADHGHRHIGHIAGPERVASSTARQRGFLAEAKRLGLAAAPVAHGTFSEEGGAKAATSLLGEHPELTALYVSTLGQAIGVLHAARAAGRSVPGDLSVLTYDELPMAAYLEPPLTTLAMPLQEVGATAVDALLEQLEGKPPRDFRVPAEPRVITRASVGPPPSRD
ncbi:LacI family DNA-binding transcriptional regulator [Streptomyces daqingensis]|uniref:LacI family DNA-binding transcriptional regulator n=1 Tax=Streptomyces daqingensis TaxID=1472640 RepID=UPI001E2BF123|nr:LacI family DNA-binding transcriptional regulator [Streptomyces daqingensis]